MIILTTFIDDSDQVLSYCLVKMRSHGRVGHNNNFYYCTNEGQAVSVCTHGKNGYSCYNSLQRVSYDGWAGWVALYYPRSDGYMLEGRQYAADWRANLVLRALL